MDWILGITDWCQLGPTCKVNWDAWGAIGTMAAVALALFLALREGTLRRKSAASKSKVVALQLIENLEKWQTDLAVFVKHLEKQRSWPVAEALSDTDEGGPSILEVPSAVRARLPELAEIGIAGELLGDAFFRLKNARRYSTTILSYAKNGILNEQIYRAFTAEVRHASRLLAVANHRLEEPFVRNLRFAARYKRSDGRPVWFVDRVRHAR